jgi:hypothetical protein
MLRPTWYCWCTSLLAAGALACSGESLTAPPAPGALQIVMTTSGPEPDLDGYLLRIDDGAPQLVGTVETVEREAVPGNHTAVLEGVAPNCTVSDNPQGVTVVSAETATITFEVSCTATRGSIRVTVTTEGSPPDPDGYLLILDGSDGKPIESTIEVSFIDLPPGSHTVGIGGISGQCRVTEEASQETTVTAGTTSDVVFHVVCAPTLIAFSSNGFDLQAIFVVKPDGTGLKQLSPEGAFDLNPTWSPDGRRLLFTDFQDLYVMNADGSGRARLVEGRSEVGIARWSPDGKLIAFTFQDFVGDDFVVDLWVMRSDGSDRTRLATGIDAGPSWSPDSRQIAYTRGQVRIINADGTDDRRVTQQPFLTSEPAWSPDGGLIAFVTTLEDRPDRPADRTIFVVNPDGNGLVDLTRGRGSDETPTWSPDGSRIAFTFAEDEEEEEGSEIGVMNRDGSARTNLTSRPGFDYGPDWSPDGRGIVYTRSTSEDSEIYVMDADGGGQTNVSNRPDTFEDAPDWAGRSSSFSARSRARAERLRLRAHPK